MCKEGLLCHVFYQPCNLYGYLNFFANFTNCISLHNPSEEGELRSIAAFCLALQSKWLFRFLHFTALAMKGAHEYIRISTAEQIF
jgi:hypothetical protein